MRRLLCLLLACGCATARKPEAATPVDTTRAFVAALQRVDADAAYALLHPDLRAAQSPQAFRAQLQNYAPETRALAEQLAQSGQAPVARARVTLENGEPVQLVLEAGQWRLEGGVLDAQSLATPLDAVSALRHALARRSLPALLRLLSRERRAQLTAALEQTLSGSEDLQDLEVDINGDDAVVHLSGGGEILLRREAGKWRLQDSTAQPSSR